MTPTPSGKVLEGTAYKTTDNMKSEAVLEKQKSDFKKSDYKMQLVWNRVAILGYFHLAGLYGMYLMCTKAHILSPLIMYGFVVLTGLGTGAGCHRLWSHRAYKAKLPMKIIMMCLQTIGYQGHIYGWVRDHRVHHKFVDTDADPHNSKRGFFFSHMGWLMVRKHPDVKRKGATVDISDLKKEPVVMFQKKYYLPMVGVFCFAIPSMVVHYVCGETWFDAYHMSVSKFLWSTHLTWLINSGAHMWGARPYDQTMTARNNLALAVAVVGEGWHNYHHVFPWDYKSSELGNYKTNTPTAFIDFFAWLGLAYDLKTVPVSMINKRALRTGDGTRNSQFIDDNKPDLTDDTVWGWDDKDMNEQDKKLALILNKEH